MFKIRSKIKRIAALSLACLTAISTPLISLANTGLGGNVAGSSSGGQLTSLGGDFGVNVSPDRQGRIGIRLSLVDSTDPSRVISVLPDGETPMVVDILYVDKATFEHFTKQPNPYLSELNEYTGALKAPVRCFGNHLSGKGKSSFQTDNECSGAAILKK